MNSIRNCQNNPKKKNYVGLDYGSGTRYGEKWSASGETENTLNGTLNSKSISVLYLISFLPINAVQCTLTPFFSFLRLCFWEILTTFSVNRAFWVFNPCDSQRTVQEEVNVLRVHAHLFKYIELCVYIWSLKIISDSSISSTSRNNYIQRIPPEFQQERPKLKMD